MYHCNGGISARVAKPRKLYESKLKKLIFECLRWGPVRPRDIVIAAGLNNDSAGYSKVVRRLRNWEKRGIVYSTKEIIKKQHGGTTATWYDLPPSKATWYELDYAERVKRHGKTEPWTVAR